MTGTSSGNVISISMADTVTRAVGEFNCVIPRGDRPNRGA